MYALDTLTEPGVWRTLKRTLNHGKLEIQPMDLFFPFASSVLKPEPIEINAKIILIGDREMYELLYEYEEDFRKIFKVHAEFDEEMNMTDEVILEYGGRLRKLSDDEKLCPFDRAQGGAAQQGDGAVHGPRRPGARGVLRREGSGRIAGARRARAAGH
jgi:predicted ATP-dependent protease